MHKFEQKSLKKIKSIKNTWYDWFISYIPESIRKSVGCFNGKIFSLFETNTHEQTVHGRGKKWSKPKTQNIRNPFMFKKKKKKLKMELLEIFEHFLQEKN